MSEAAVTRSRLVVTDCGHAEYAECLRLQERLVAGKLAGDRDDYLLFVSHAPVVTVGRAAEAEDEAAAGRLAAQGVEVVRITRGGRLTYHGPGQIVGYPIVALRGAERDLHRYIRNVEAAIIGALGRHGVRGYRIAGKTGVWAQGRKIAAVGVAVRGWVTYHGFALNVSTDPGEFRGFAPCGLAPEDVGSLASLGTEVSEDALRRSLAESFGRVLQREIAWREECNSLQDGESKVLSTTSDGSKLIVGYGKQDGI